MLIKSESLPFYIIYDCKRTKKQKLADKNKKMKNEMDKKYNKEIEINKNMKLKKKKRI